MLKFNPSLEAIKKAIFTQPCYPLTPNTPLYPVFNSKKFQKAQLVDNSQLFSQISPLNLLNQIERGF